MNNNNINEDKKYLEIPDSDIVLPAAVDSYLRQKLKTQSLEACGDSVGKFAECSKDKYISVVWECRELQQLMKNCLSDYTTKEKLVELKREWIDASKKKLYEKRQKAAAEKEQSEQNK
ncbi:hypothetical protein DICPUDRAFT_160085 [Dictyostelium purpureum]|uniref:COX assembly mitochondrial protein n=1 Tax=Dictyostelium purpureum TaxID=5786 RepID=F1A5P1_DICPU|nr:uncharacterized protein DICPUDRAFT_160085 [Dictyostelium purpureum]EGC28491.1 hypothetical protein DICPUDRAFT_160085 [Dictyostelium purpureum]|eukprot:XP_003294986.1 hypothetical protein DICPUDRAFT_160085 [Dictyostelium purpureum]